MRAYGSVAVQDRQDAGAVQAIFLLRASPEDGAEVRLALRGHRPGGTGAEPSSQCLCRSAAAWARSECRLSATGSRAPSCMYARIDVQMMVSLNFIPTLTLP